MSDNTDVIEAPAADAGEEDTVHPEIRDDDNNLSADFVSFVQTALANGDRDALIAVAKDLHEADTADLIEALDADERIAFIDNLGEDFDYLALIELDETIRDEIVEALPNERLAEAVQEFDSDDAVELLEDMDAEDQSAILSFMPAAERIAIQRSLEYPEDSAGRLMQMDFIAVPPFWTVGDAIDYSRESDDLPDEFYELFVIDPSFHLVGTLPLYRLLRTKRPVKVEEIMDPARHWVDLTDDQEEVARVFERYNLVSVPVLDASERLVGVITVDDIVDVIHEEADEDIKRLGGVGDEGIADTVASITRYRFPWLFINLLTAIAASMVISLFEGVIAQVVALAVLMPIVASMGGNAGTQSLTVAVRALATRELTSSNARRIVIREITVGLLNGIGFAVIMGILGGLWAESVTVGLVLAGAMVINMLVAGLAGILIPITLEKLKFDPAVSSAVFV
ncbi:MAG: magnesium transporter, partial [Rhodobiaceae bacterium]|nr:magnesium transporter [Rhodobiaceae bacterium]